MSETSVEQYRKANESVDKVWSALTDIEQANLLREGMPENESISEALRKAVDALIVLRTRMENAAEDMRPTRRVEIFEVVRLHHTVEVPADLEGDALVEWFADHE